MKKTSLLRESCAAVRIQRNVRARLARNEVAAIRHQRRFDELSTSLPPSLLIRPRTKRLKEQTSLNALKFIKAGDAASLDGLVKLPGLELDDASVELRRREVGKYAAAPLPRLCGNLSKGAQCRLTKCRGLTGKLPNIEKALNSELDKLVELHAGKNPKYVYDTCTGELRVDTRVGNNIVRAASKTHLANKPVRSFKKEHLNDTKLHNHIQGGNALS